MCEQGYTWLLSDDNTHCTHILGYNGKTVVSLPFVIGYLFDERGRGQTQIPRLKFASLETFR